MRILRRLLPLVAVAALLVTLVVPIMVPSDLDHDAFFVTSAGERGSTELLPVMLVLWGMVLLAAGTAWIPRVPALWAVLALVAALPLLLVPAAVVLEPPRLMWDGWDEVNDRPTGGMVVGLPFIGSALWVLGAAALTASGVLGIVEAVRSRRPAGRAPAA